MERKVYRIKIEEIASKDRYSPTFCPNLEGLCASIKEIGQIEPVILRAGERGWEVVCGLKRVVILEKSSGEVEALLFSGEELPPDKAVRVSIAHNVWGKMNIIEKAHAVLKLEKEGIPIYEIIKSWLPLFGMGPKREVFEMLKNIGQLPDELKKYIACEDLSFSTVTYFLDFTHEELKNLTHMLLSLKLSESKLKEVLGFIRYICLMEGIDVNALLNESKHIWNNPSSTPIERTESFRDWLRRRRYPYFGAMEIKFKEVVKKLGLPLDMLKPPPFFEDEEYTVTFKFKNREEFIKFTQMLGEAAQKLSKFSYDPFKELA